MRTRIAASALTAAALLALTTACAPGDGKAGHSSGGPAATPTASIDYKAVIRALGIVPAPAPAPVGAKRTALLAALRGISPALVAEPDKAVSNARSQCSTLDGPGDPNGLSAAERFGADNTHPLTVFQGVAIDVALRETLCPAG